MARRKVKSKKELMAQELAELRVQVVSLRAAVLLRDKALTGALSVPVPSPSPQMIQKILEQYKEDKDDQTS